MLYSLVRNGANRSLLTFPSNSFAHGLCVSQRGALKFTRDTQGTLARSHHGNEHSRLLGTTTRALTSGERTCSPTNPAQILPASWDESHSSSLHELTRPESLWEALRSGNFETVASALSSSLRDSKVLETLPATSFRSLLQEAPGLRQFINSLRLVSRGFHPTAISKLGGLRQPRDIFDAYENLLRSIFAQWKGMGRELRLHEYASLLEIAGILRDGNLARDVWASMKENGVVPDTKCHNFYYEVLCWHQVHDQFEDYNLRVTRRSLKVRTLPTSKRWTRFKSYTTGQGGLRQEVVKTFEAMGEKETQANACTYTLFMLALGREGDINAVKEVMKKAWAIDVDSIMTDSHDALASTTDLSMDSPLFPGQLLLFTTAHVFGANNLLPTALRLVDFISRTFSLEIDLDTWDQLMSWTYILSAKRSRKVLSNPKRSDESDGQLPLQSVERIWQTMTAAPYFREPSIRMWDLRVRSLAKHDTTLRTLIEAMKAGRDKMQMQEEHFASPQSFGGGVHKELVRSLRARNFNVLTSWIKLALSKVGGLNQTLHFDDIFRKVPSFLVEWLQYAGSFGAAYDTPSGRVQFNIWQETKMTKEIWTPYLPARHGQCRLVVQAAEKSSSKPYLGVTRYMRLNRRHRIRSRQESFSPYPSDLPEAAFCLREFKAEPAWHESNQVRNA